MLLNSVNVAYVAQSFQCLADESFCAVIENNRLMSVLSLFARYETEP